MASVLRDASLGFILQTNAFLFRNTTRAERAKSLNKGMITLH